MQTKNDKRLLANDGICLVTHPEIALTLGKSEAIFLQQLHYWLTSDNEIGTTLDGKRWIYNSYKSWTQNLRIYSESTIRRAISKLEKMGIVLTQNLNKKRSDHTKWYTINYDALKSLIPIASTKKQKRAGEVELDERLLKMNSPSVQNEQIINENKNNFRNKILSHTKTPRKIYSQNDFVENKQPPIEKNLLQQMILIWNQVVEEGKRTVELNGKRISFLRKAFETKFQNCLEKWKDFCKRVASSKFLMGEIKASFRASLDWVLKFDILQRILEGDYGVGDRTVYTKKETNTRLDLEDKIRSTNEDQIIKQLRLDLLNQLGSAVYSSWFNEAQIKREEEAIIIKARSVYVKDYISLKFTDDIEKVFSLSLEDYTWELR
jgi:hypothetical protein